MSICLLALEGSARLGATYHGTQSAALGGPSFVPKLNNSPGHASQEAVGTAEAIRIALAVARLRAHYACCVPVLKLEVTQNVYNEAEQLALSLGLTISELAARAVGKYVEDVRDTLFLGAPEAE